MRKLDLFWKTNREWYYYDENLSVHLKSSAPDEAKESFKKYLAQKEAGKEVGGYENSTVLH